MIKHPSDKTLLAVFVALLGLLALTVFLAEIDLGRWNFVAAVSIATTKAALILWFFMNVKNAERLVWLVAVAGFFWLSILIGGTLADYWTRSDFPYSEVIRSNQ